MLWNVCCVKGGYIKDRFTINYNLNICVVTGHAVLH